MASVPDDVRECVMRLFFVEHVAMEDIAELLTMPVAMVRAVIVIDGDARREIPTGPYDQERKS